MVLKTLHLMHTKIYTLCFLSATKSLSGSVEGSGGKKIMPELLNKTFSAKAARCKSPKYRKQSYDTSPYVVARYGSSEIYHSNR